MRDMRRFLPLLLASVAFVLGAGEDSGRGKMCWAHYVGWGFNQVAGYDEAAKTPGEWMLQPFADRSLLGRNLQWDTGIFFGARRQIESALAYGVDGFCVDVVNPKSWTPTLSRFFRDAEGTRFKVALCIDRLSYDNDVLLAALDSFIRRYQDHPNACRIDGKMVIFVYNLGGKAPGEWLAVREELRKRGLDACYIGQPMHETSMWDDPVRLEQALRCFDGLYDFGCNGFTPEEMKQRLANGRAAIAAKKPGALLVGGIAVGYLGQGSAYYRPYRNSGTLRHNWEAALAGRADWVCLTTWNDYVENTQFEPSVVNRDNLLMINREFLDLWRGTVPPDRPPRVIYSYHEETVVGDDLTVEVLNFRYTSPASRAWVRLIGLAGEVLHEFAPVELAADRMGIATLRLNHDVLKDWKYLRVQAAVTAGDGRPEYRELYPIVRRFGRVESVRTVRVRQDDLTAPAVSLRIEAGKEGAPVAKVRISGWTFAGKLELLRNGWPVAEREISHFKAPAWNGEIPLPEMMRSPEDGYLVRLTDVSGRIGFSNPAVHRRAGMEAKSRQPVIVTGSDFDENWPLWQERISRLRHPEIRRIEATEADLFAFSYPFNREEAGLLVSDSGWAVPARLGRRERRETEPQWVETDGPGGGRRTVLSFDGGVNVVAVAVRSMPYGVFTLEMWVRPEAKGADMVLFYDRADLCFKLDAALRPVLRRRKTEVTADRPVEAGKWSHLAAVYDGRTLAIYRDGRRVAGTAAETFSNPVNSVPCIGNTLELNAGFRGEMAGFRLESAVRAPEEFRLLRK